MKLKRRFAVLELSIVERGRRSDPVQGLIYNATFLSQKRALMGQKMFPWIAFLILTAAMPGSALADVKLLGTYQSWNAFGGTAVDGKAVCGIMTNFSDARHFSVRLFNGTPGLEVLMAKTGWSIPANTKSTAIIKFGNNVAWTTPLSGSADVLQGNIGPEQLKTFVHEITSSDTFAVTFLEGSELPWIGTLNGTSAAFNRMGSCVAAMMPPAVTQPFTSQNTQPFAPVPMPPSQGAPNPDAKMVTSPAMPGRGI